MLLFVGAHLDVAIRDKKIANLPFLLFSNMWEYLD